MRAVLFLLASAAAPLAAQAQAPTAGLGWLAGCWRADRGATTVEERWTGPAGGMLLGTGKTVRNGAVTEYEFTRIFARGDTLVYAAMPSGQTPAEFRDAAPARDSVVFTNPEHDFPKFVAYRPIGRDSLLAWIGAGSRRIEFRYARVACTG